MPMWPTADATAAERAAKTHQDKTGNAPAHVANAPATWLLIGEHVDYSGGVVLAALAEHQAAVAVSPRTDDLVKVTKLVTGPAGVTETSDEVSMGVIGDLAAAQQPGIDDHGRPETPPTPPGGLAVELAGILWTLINRQLLSRDTGGVDVTIINDIPDGAGLGDEAARDVAFVLAVLGDCEELDDAPGRARIAEVCTQAAEMFSPVAPLRARYTAALRGAGDTVSVIDYADGSVTQAPHPQSADLEFYAITVDKPRTDRAEGISRRRRFVEEACRAFGTESLRLLPDAPQRVIEWLQAVHKVHGTDNTPEIGEAASWLAFEERETVRAQRLARALRARRTDDIWPLLAQSQSGLTGPYGLLGSEAMVQLCLVRGALGARAASAGNVEAVIAGVDARRAGNFTRDMSDDGLVVVKLGRGQAASRV
ncbi:MAG: galactokinase family protein [Corynebacterium sp.]|uniref:galactokinase family protein n=1 Tax=Corynebacterium sp. TaxID=1720 RepID=UPI0026DF8984|nr:galactokinase family protein [Corynebacterium sp.]MDO5669138.1 galactokinase family protein [Corynebacterium sp.]